MSFAVSVSRIRCECGTGPCSMRVSKWSASRGETLTGTLPGGRILPKKCERPQFCGRGRIAISQCDGSKATRQPRHRQGTRKRPSLTGSMGMLGEHVRSPEYSRGGRHQRPSRTASLYTSTGASAMHLHHAVEGKVLLLNLLNTSRARGYRWVD